MNPLVSVLIPVYNREKYIEETVRSAISQTYENIEIIIVDNFSTDSTWDILINLSKKDNRISIHRNKENVGPVLNWKKCIDLGKGEFAKILFSDDLMVNTFIEECIKHFNDKEVGFVFTGREIFENDNRTIQYMSIGRTGTYNTNKYIKGIFFKKNYPNSPGCALFRLKDLRNSLIVDIPNKVNSISRMHGIGSDLLIFLKIAAKYTKFTFIDRKLVRFRAHSDSISVSSKAGKLLLHYAIAKAHFVENHKMSKNDIKKFNTQLKYLMYKYDSKMYNIHRINDFYLKNTALEYNYFILMAKIIYSNLRKSFRIAKNKLLLC